MISFIKHFTIHKWLVFWYMLMFCYRLMCRAITHDMSKLKQPERDAFVALSRNDALKKHGYNTPGYKAEIEKHRPIIDVHYKNNRHHPNHHKFGVEDMNLYDVIEMVCDWKAAGRRTKGGNLKESVEKNKERYMINDYTHRLIFRTFVKTDINKEVTR